MEMSLSMGMASNWGASEAWIYNGREDGEHQKQNLNEQALSTSWTSWCYLVSTYLRMDGKKNRNYTKQPQTVITSQTDQTTSNSHRVHKSFRLDSNPLNASLKKNPGMLRSFAPIESRIVIPGVTQRPDLSNARTNHLPVISIISYILLISSWSGSQHQTSELIINQPTFCGFSSLNIAQVLNMAILELG